MLTLYGIPNCDTVKKARTWLTENGHEFTFHDFKKQGISRQVLAAWAAQVGWQTVLNRQGTTWRKLDAATHAGVVDAESAIAVLLAHPSAIKRPVLIAEQRIIVGFAPDRYQAFFA